MTVNEYVKHKVLPEYRALITKVRQIIRETAPNTDEVIRYGMPCYRRHDIFAYLNSSRTGVTVSFVHGVEIADNYGLLKGNAKWARFVKLRRPEDLNKIALKYYVREAVKLDGKRA